jgi:hypothetical protein
MATRIEPTAEQLHAAWLVRRRSHWPATLDETMADPLYAALVRSAAVQRVLADRRTAQATAAWQALPAPAARPRQQTPWPPRRPAAAAAGDRDDD